MLCPQSVVVEKVSRSYYWHVHYTHYSIKAPFWCCSRTGHFCRRKTKKENIWTINKAGLQATLTRPEHMSGFIPVNSGASDYCRTHNDGVLYSYYYYGMGIIQTEVNVKIFYVFFFFFLQTPSPPSPPSSLQPPAPCPGLSSSAFLRESCSSLARCCCGSVRAENTVLLPALLQEQQHRRRCCTAPTGCRIGSGREDARPRPRVRRKTAWAP